MKDDLSITSNGRTVTGWTQVRVTAGIERAARDFELGLTDLPGTTAFQPGAFCEVKLGNDLVLSGYVDRYRMAMAPGMHEITCSGRSKTQDLIDCSAEWPQQQMQASTVLDVARRLAAPYDVGVKIFPDSDTAAGDLRVYPQLLILKGETAFEIIERVARFSAVLVTDDAEGNLVLTRTGSAKAAGSITQGVNVEAATVDLSADQLYSRYVIYGLNRDQLPDARTDPIPQKEFFEFPGDGVARNRQLYMLAEQVQNFYEQALQSLIWDINRRIARSQIVSVTVDSWRDGNDDLWQPNTLATVDLPMLKVSMKRMLIGEVTYRRDAQGTHADLVLMDPKGFDSKPTSITAGVIFDSSTQAPVQGLKR